jgi:hypothetical protein
MKIRLGFVSNSSSASFYIAVKYLSQDQISKIYNHITAVKDLKENEKISAWKGGEADERDAWHIWVQDDILHGFTVMDNFDMEGFLEAIGVPQDKIEWNNY